MGVAAFMFFTHVHRMATRPMSVPATPSFRAFPANPAGSRLAPPTPRGYPGRPSGDALDWRVLPPMPPPPAEMGRPVRVDPQRYREPGRAGWRGDRGWDDGED
jgi:hypothetical protein